MRTGAILTNRGRSVTLRHARITSAAPSGVEPHAAPPAAMLGQLTLISNPAAHGQSSQKSSRARTYSSVECPATWQITLVPASESSESQGPESAANDLTPGFCRPTEFIIPPGTSVMRGAGLPGQGSAAQPLVVMAPSLLTSMSSLNCQPYPNVPDAVLIGFFILTPPKSTDIFTLLTRPPPS